MEFSVAGFLGAVVGAALGAVNYTMFAAMIDGKLRAAAAAAAEEGRAVPPEELERRISAGRRGILAFNMLVFVAAGYWAGQVLVR